MAGRIVSRTYGSYTAALDAVADLEAADFLHTEISLVPLAPEAERADGGGVVTVQADNDHRASEAEAILAQP